MLQNAANYMSRSDLLRGLSTHSSNTSGSSNRGSMRITKPSSASNSPSHVQRRRTTGNHSTRSGPKGSQETPYQTREQRLRNYYGSRQNVDFSRPMSWHPASDQLQTQGPQIPTSEPALGNTIANLENLAVTGTPDTSVQQSIQNAFAMGYGFPTSAEAMMYDPSLAQPQGFGVIDSNSNFEHDSYPIYSVSDQAQGPYVSQAPTYNAYSTAGYQPEHHWPQNTFRYSSNPENPPTLQHNPPNNVSINTARKVKATSAPQLVRRKSKELVGMGLYDDRGRDFISSLNSGVGENAGRDSIGKGLKLEETWQPPIEDEEDDDDDEGYSTDEAEEVEEVLPPTMMASSPAEPQTAFYPTTFGDMSNQSFFFNDDEEYTTGDPANYFPYYQTLPTAHPKPQSNPGMENYLWF